MRRQLYLVLAIVAGALLAPMAHAVDFTNQVFESGSLGPVDNSTNNGVPSTATPDQWHLWSVSGTNRATIGSTGRTFQTGTSGNDQALFYRPATPGMPNAQGDLEGAMFRSSTPYSVLPGQVVYTVMETFSDLGSVSASQLLKVDVRFGLAGNSLDYGGFSNALPEYSVVSNMNTLLSGQNQGIASVTSGGPVTNSHFPHIKYDGAAAESSEANARAAYDRSYVMSAIYRPVSGGTNAEMTSTDGVNAARYLEGRSQTLTPNPITSEPEFAPNTINPMQTSIDRVTIHFRRNLGTYNGINVSEFNAYGPLSAFPAATNTASAGYSSSILRAEGTGEILNPTDIKIGIKSLRIGATWDTDVNVDGVVNAADKALVTANQGLTAATLLQGDVTNDGLVDAADLALFNTLLGDYDVSGTVDGNDFLVWQAQLGATVTPGSGADGNRSGTVDATDLAVWKGQLGQVASAVAAVGAVPEPATGALLAVGVAWATGAVRRQNRRRRDIV